MEEHRILKAVVGNKKEFPAHYAKEHARGRGRVGSNDGGRNDKRPLGQKRTIIGVSAPNDKNCAGKEIRRHSMIFLGKAILEVYCPQ